VRIIDETGKVISPFFFLDVSKTSKYYIKITKQVLQNSFKMAENTNKEISINLSFIDMQCKAITDKIIDYFSNRPDIAKKITFEILEDENIKNFTLVKEFIKKIKNYGVKIAIDDFGAGYSSFERLLEFEPDILKIDASLIKNIETSSLNRKIVETMQNFAKSLGIKTVAEFVSNENIFNIINDIGIDYTQGYFIDEPRATIK
jgi:EAL domain-containing protein (putative c-di-GMP-specific phosphodiesterase class I)